jgi:hypothetical protein
MADQDIYRTPLPDKYLLLDKYLFPDQHLDSLKVNASQLK